MTRGRPRRAPRSCKQPESVLPMYSRRWMVSTIATLLKSHREYKLHTKARVEELRSVIATSEKHCASSNRSEEASMQESIAASIQEFQQKRKNRGQTTEDRESASAINNWLENRRTGDGARGSPSGARPSRLGQKQKQHHTRIMENGEHPIPARVFQPIQEQARRGTQFQPSDAQKSIYGIRDSAQGDDIQFPTAGPQGSTELSSHPQGSQDDQLTVSASYRQGVTHAPCSPMTRDLPLQPLANWQSLEIQARMPHLWGRTSLDK